MVLKYRCTSCKNMNTFSPKYNTRGDLQMKLNADEADVNCFGCGKREKVHLNKIEAFVDKKITLLAFVGGLVLSVVLLFFFGLVSLLMLCLPILVWSIENKAAHNFNKYRIKRRK